MVKSKKKETSAHTGGDTLRLCAVYDLSEYSGDAFRLCGGGNGAVRSAAYFG